MAAEGEFPKSDGDVLYGSEANGLVPVGTVLPWLKSYTNTPSLTGQFVECNGQTLSDSDSVYDGQVIPDLNGSVNGTDKGRFLRGHSSSGVTETSANLSHTHTVPTYTPGSAGSNIGNSNSASPAGSITSGSTGGTESRPYNYSVVFVMRIK